MKRLKNLFNQKFRVLILLLIISSTLLNNQSYLLAQSSTTGNIEGVVTEKNTGEMLPFLNVILESKGHMITGASTDFDGHYTINNIKPGVYDLIFSFIGYKCDTINSILVFEDSTIIINRSMDRERIELKEAILVEYKTPLFSKDQTVTAQSLNSLLLISSCGSSVSKKRKKTRKKDLQKIPTRSVNGVAKTVGGIYSKDGGESQLNSRGARSDRQYIYIDGVKVRGAQSISKSSLQEVTVITGGLPAQYENYDAIIPEPTTHISSYDFDSAPGTITNDPGTVEIDPETTTQEPEKPVIDKETAEKYEEIIENLIIETLKENTSTFSIDVDVASYANIRRFINKGQSPPPGSVRLEEMINYFDYSYPQIEDTVPFSFHTEVAPSPWDVNKKLVHIGIKGNEIKKEEAKPNNLVFLIDVSGSMSYQLQLVQQSLSLLVEELRPVDYISLVVYAGNSGLVLPATSCHDKSKILSAINRLSAGGSTAGGAGIKLAYKTAIDNFIEDGNNRVILCTDGDFNVGVSSESGLVNLIEEKRESGVSLSVLGFGRGNYQDQKMEQLADHGNGNYAYIDRIEEAQKVLVDEMMGTLSTIAKDVKIQVEFDSLLVKNYRLIGYENRVLENEDFEDDLKDAGEIGAGHTVTAMYEVELSPNVQDKHEIVELRIRYKDPRSRKSKLLTHQIKSDSLTLGEASEDLRFSAAVAGFGLLLRGSKYLNGYKTAELLAMANSAKGADKKGYRKEFIKLVSKAQNIGLIALR